MCYVVPPPPPPPQINVNTNISELGAFLSHLLFSTNMRCLTPEQALTGECGFLAANLYARSIFGEDALANLSIEKPVGAAPGSSVQGHIRIRAKTQVYTTPTTVMLWSCYCLQGMALSLGDKINLSQKKTVSSA